MIRRLNGNSCRESNGMHYEKNEKCTKLIDIIYDAAIVSYKKFMCNYFNKYTYIPKYLKGCRIQKLQFFV